MTVWIALVVAILGSWWLGYFSRRHPSPSDNGAGLRRDYLRGVNYLLNEEPDKAVDVFIKMLEVDGDTVETHLAVGKLFRRRGEVDRAIRIHQNLIARPDLDKAYRDQSLFELGQDYLSAGVLDRAERVLQESVNVKQYAIPALKALRDIYEREKEWENAIRTVERLAQLTRDNLSPTIAHYYCELAEKALAALQPGVAMTALEHALQVDTNCVRASLLHARLLMKENDYRAALKQLKKIRQQNADYLSEAVDDLARCYEGLHDETHMVKFFMQMVDEYPHVPVVLILAERIRQQKGDKVAQDYVADYVRRYPSLRGLQVVIDLHLSTMAGQARDDLMILHNLTKKLLADKPDYRCAVCGFGCNSLNWQCPGCHRWNTIKPLHCFEGM